MSNLNDQQQEVVNSNADRLVVLAGAGAGKTFTMLERISRLVKEGQDPESILVLTFTNAAAFNMKSRYLSNHRRGRIPTFSTFHAYCYSLLIRDSEVRNKLGYNKVPRIATQGEVKNIHSKCKIMLGIKMSESKLTGEEPLTSLVEKQQYEMYYNLFDKTMKLEGIITFDALADRVSHLFTSRDTIVTKYVNKIKYLFIDEFQDTDMKQVRFAGSFVNAKVCVFGDCLQNLYSFRGTTNEIIKSLAKSDDWSKIRLFENYRSTQQICKFANKMSTYADNEYRIEMHGQRDGDPVEVIPGSDCSWNVPVDTYHLKILVDRLKENESGTVAVLCRTNKEVSLIKQSLLSNNIVLCQREGVENAEDLIQCVYDDKYMIDWLSSMLPAEDYANYMRLSCIEDDSGLEWFMKTYSSNDQINSNIRIVMCLRKIMNSSDLPVVKFANMMKELNLKSAGVDSISSDSDVINTISSMLEEQGGSGVYVGTIHSSKGLEYDTVYVMGVGDKCFRQQCEDDYNLYYVAITRAKDHLVVFTK